MKCPRCGERLVENLRGRVACLNLRCTWTGDEWSLLEPQPMGETVYWKPGWRDSLNRVTVGAILHFEVDNG
jgi:hypothetical protein